MLSAPMEFVLEKQLKDAEEKIALLERISKLETELKEWQTEKISQLELKLKESLQANADCTTKLSGLERQLQQAEQMIQKFKTSFKSMQAKLNMTNSELDNTKLRISTSAIDADSRVEMIKALHMLCEKNERIMVRYEGDLDIYGWQSSPKPKFEYVKTHEQFALFWCARQVQRKFDHLLKLEFHDGVLQYMIHDANEEVSKMKVDHSFMATCVERIYLEVVLWSISREMLKAVPWNYHTNEKATEVEILDFILEVITSRDMSQKNIVINSEIIYHGSPS